MARKSTYHAPFFDDLIPRIHGTPIRLGFLVGTELEEDLRDVMFAAPTWTEDIPACSDIEDMVHLEESADLLARVHKHFAELRRTLPGNLQPCGCFVVTAAPCQQVADFVCPILENISDPLVLTICRGNLSFWLHSCNGLQASMKLAKLRASSHQSALVLWAAATVDLIVPRSRREATADVLADAIRLTQSAVVKSLSCYRVGSVNDGEEARILDIMSDSKLSSIVPRRCAEQRVIFLPEAAASREQNSSDAPVHISVPDPEQPELRRQSWPITACVFLPRRDCQIQRVINLLREAVLSCSRDHLEVLAEQGNASSFLPRHSLYRVNELNFPLWCSIYCMPKDSVASVQQHLGKLMGIRVQSLEEVSVLSAEEKMLWQQSAACTAGDSGAAMAPDKSKDGSSLRLLVCATAACALILALAIPLIVRM